MKEVLIFLVLGLILIVYSFKYYNTSHAEKKGIAMNFQDCQHTVEELEKRERISNVIMILGLTSLVMSAIIYIFS